MSASASTVYRCCDLQRRNLVADHPTLNGIDYLEVLDRELLEFDPLQLRQRTLLVHCLKPLPATFFAGNVQVIGGERIKSIEVSWAAPAAPLPAPLLMPGEAAVAAVVNASPDAERVLVVRTAATGDFSTYNLRLVVSPLADDPPPDFDPRLAAIDFSFKIECPSEFDCKPQHECPPTPDPMPDIDYLAKDYSSFRRLLLDRMAQLVPQWQQSSTADTGIAVAELLAYAADQLSYQQDAIATEAYLGTARRRVSLRRHALLADYPMHEGCNARAWLQLQVASWRFDLPLAGTQFLTRLPGFPTGLALDSPQLDAAMHLAPQVFEPLLEARLAPDYRQPLYAAHNCISFYTWSDERCCLPKGAVRATLSGCYPGLRVGDALLFEEVLGPRTGQAPDADPAHRHVVQLTRVLPVAPAKLEDPLTGAPITEIEWALADTLPFALCISGRTDADHGARQLDDISVARGNLVLVDHGRAVRDEALGSVPQPTLYAVASAAAGCGDLPPRVAIPPRYRPRLAAAPLTHSAGRCVSTANGGIGTAAGPFTSAAQALDWSMDQVFPQIALDSALDERSQRWQPQRHLLNSAPDATDFVVEVDDEGVAQLRFGDDEHGERPASGTAFSTIYRVGNGSAGNVGADSIVHIVGQPGDLAQVISLRNPLPALGGVDPESAESVRRNAPQAFRRQERAVTTADYAAIAQRNALVQRAAATLRWTGSWYTAFVTVDPLAGVDSAPLKGELEPLLDRYRMAGHDLEFNDPHYVSLEIDLHVCVKDEYFRSDVKQSLLQLFSNRRLAGDGRGLFHPDNFTFGQTVYLSPLYAAAHQVPGVASLQVTRFQRQGIDDPSFRLRGELPLSALEIARLDNDPNRPERGVLRLDIHGGK
jgi:hypothetical protein